MISHHRFHFHFKISPKVFALLNKLDKLVLEYNGRLYLTKDVRMSKDMFAKTYGHTKFSNKFTSLQFERLCDT